MTYLILDTDVASWIHGNRPEATRYEHHLRHVVPMLTFISVGEMHFGAFQSRWGERRVTELDAYIRRCLVLPYDDRLPRTWARLRAHAKRAGHPLAHREHSNDLWIAACAVHYQAPLLTGNARHFLDVPGLDVLGVSE